MGWEKKLAIAGAIPLVLLPILVLTLFSEALNSRFDVPTPGIVANGLLLQLFPPRKGDFIDLSPLVWIFAVDLLSWIVIFTVTYALIRKKKTLLKWMRIPLAVILALESCGLALRSAFFTPGAVLFRLVHPNSSNPGAIAFSLAVALDAICWIGIFVGASKLVPKLRHRLQ
ncbi:MAG TPA: hypothetical protein VKB49_24410 [Candidatus Sulfotelmatobacter sp.]|nr:hypothetical protein [Candidatus Sulfotelmatobacter sp.]